MKKLSALFFGFILLTGFLFPKPVSAVTIASQTQGYVDQLNVWQFIQELGNNLSGTLTTFTFRVRTSSSNTSQFGYTAQNSKMYDKTTNALVATGCVPSGASTSDALRGLSFTTSGVSSGYEDVTIDFSCNNYSFVNGHNYLIKVTNSNQCTGCIKVAAAAYGGGGSYIGSDYFTGGGLRLAFDNGVCNPTSYVWNSQSANSGCNIWATTKDDIYFVLNNSTAPLPAVVFIPGIGGSELQTSAAVNWSASDGHGGTYTHSYPSGEKIWVNQTQAIIPGFDDYFDILRLNSDGQTPAASLSLTGNLNSFGYSDIDSFFQGLGYQKGTNYFVFNYDWRMDIGATKDSLDALVEQAKTASGQSQVILVAHSLGGLVARNYISDSTKASKVSKLIELGVPHLGAPWATKAVLEGVSLSYKLRFFSIPIIPGSEINDIVQNFPSALELLPSTTYFNFYNNSDSLRPYPFRDERDIDSNQVTGSLSYTQTKTLMGNEGVNQTLLNQAESFHNSLDPSLSQTNGVTLYEIVGSGQPTLGQIRETWLISWPIATIDKTDEVFINGDDTVPLYSASLKSDSLDLSSGATIYYVPQTHADLVTANGAAMQIVKSILLSSTLPSDAQTVKTSLEGLDVSVDQNAAVDLYDSSNNHTGLDQNGDVETNISDTFYDSTGNTTHVFVKKSAPQVTLKVSSSSSTNTNIKVMTYSQDTITNTYLYQEVPTNTGDIEANLDPTSTQPPTLSVNNQTIIPTTQLSGSAATDQTAPSTDISLSGTQNSDGSYSGSLTVSLTSNDDNSGVLQTQYSLDNGTIVQNYTGPFTISSSGTTTIQYFSTDNAGNQESPHSLSVTIIDTSSDSTSSSDSSSSIGGTSASTTGITTTSTSSSHPSLNLALNDPSSVKLAEGVQPPKGQVLGAAKQMKSNYQPADVFSKIVLILVSGGCVLILLMGVSITGKLPPTKKFKK